MKRTDWYPWTTAPIRAGWYERDYSGTGLYQIRDIDRIQLDLWQQTKPGKGFWYVDEPKGQINDAFYERLPWRGVVGS